MTDNPWNEDSRPARTDRECLDLMVELAKANEALAAEKKRADENFESYERVKAALTAEKNRADRAEKALTEIHAAYSNWRYVPNGASSG